MDFSARPATKDAGRYRRRRSCTPPRFSSTLPPRRVFWKSFGQTGKADDQIFG